jgi:hypothetical protein
MVKSQRQRTALSQCPFFAIGTSLQRLLFYILAALTPFSSSQQFLLGPAVDVTSSQCRLSPSLTVTCSGTRSAYLHPSLQCFVSSSPRIASLHLPRSFQYIAHLAASPYCCSQRSTGRPVTSQRLSRLRLAATPFTRSDSGNLATPPNYIPSQRLRRAILQRPHN